MLCDCVQVSPISGRGLESRLPALRDSPPRRTSPYGAVRGWESSRGITLSANHEPANQRTGCVDKVQGQSRAGDPAPPDRPILSRIWARSESDRRRVWVRPVEARTRESDRPEGFGRARPSRIPRRIPGRSDTGATRAEAL